MKLSVSHQLFVFICMFLCGCATGVVFDVFRALRKCVKSGSGVIAVQDLLFWFFGLLIVYYTVFKVNNAKVRGYEAIALFLGAFVYFITLSEITVKVMSKIIVFILRIWMFILKPFKKLLLFLKKHLRNFIAFLNKKSSLVKNTAKNCVSRMSVHLKIPLSVKKHKI